MEFEGGNVKFFKKSVGIVLNEEYNEVALPKRVCDICADTPVQKLLVVVPTGVKKATVLALKSIAFRSGWTGVSFMSPVYTLVAHFGYKFTKAKPVMSVVIGENATDFAVISACDMTVAHTVPLGVGDCINEIILKVNTKLNIEITRAEAKMLFYSIASLLPNDTQHIKLNGFTIKADIIRDAVYPIYEQIIAGINQIVSATDVQTIRIIKDGGIYLGGVGAGLRGLANAIYAVLGFACFVPDYPKNALISGAGCLLELPEIVNEIVRSEQELNEV